LYTIIKKLNTPDKKIITLEDPIEYEFPGIVQAEVNEKK
jgi:type II secretory ATPase GspE/PulE/Tfp pilus assembly ATPase PilB-like protein